MRLFEIVLSYILNYISLPQLYKHGYNCNEPKSIRRPRTDNEFNMKRYHRKILHRIVDFLRESVLGLSLVLTHARLLNEY